MANFKKLLSKSKIMTGLQCEKALWLSTHKPSLAAPVTPQQQALFDTGHLVGAEACTRFPGGTAITAQYWDFQAACDQTADAIKAGAKDIYEASFMYNDVFARIDILHFEDGSWNIIEVKSTTKVKEEHIYDVAIQRYILDSLGLPVRSCKLMHINNQCVAPHLNDLFTLEDITDDVLEVMPDVVDEIPLLKEMLLSSSEPDIDVGEHCTSPYECKFKSYCWKSANLPSPGVFDLPGMGKKAWDHYNEGRLSMQDMQPVVEDLTDAQRRAVESSVAGELFVDKSTITKMISEWPFPLYYLDFETIGYAIPRIDGTRPFEQIPFQYSLHIQKEAGGPVEHFEYLHDDATDPREPLKAALLSHMGEAGSIVAYNRSFESRVLKALGLDSMAKRLVDPLPVFQKAVYHPDFMGSFSIKAVGPALIGGKVDYKALSVNDGVLAQEAYKKMICLAEGDEKQKLRADLIAYCELDTLSMVYLVDWLFAQSK